MAKLSLIALGLVLTVAPFVSLLGDYYEMGSIIVSDIAASFFSRVGDGSMAPGVEFIRSDDLIFLVKELSQNPPDAGLGTHALKLLIAASFFLGVWLAGLTYWVSEMMANVWFGFIDTSSK